MAQNCPFCDIFKMDVEETILMTKYFLTITPLWAVNEGHTLIVPKRHIVDPFSLNDPETRDLRIALNCVKKLLEDKFHPDGYNLAVNCGKAAGQTVFHLHYHIIPRFVGDVPDPRGGIVRNLFQDYKTSPRPPWLTEFPEQN